MYQKLALLKPMIGIQIQIQYCSILCSYEFVSKGLSEFYVSKVIVGAT